MHREREARAVVTARIKHVRGSGGEHYGVRFTCPGCEDDHIVPTKPHPKGWDFSGTDERPTLSPSIHIRWTGEDDGKPIALVCHSFVRDGRIEFLGDCTHKLAGQTVDLPPPKDWSGDG